MARVSFLTDEHVPSAVAKGLRARGLRASSVAEEKQLGSDDVSLLAYATARGTVLITADADFLKLHAANVPHAGIVFVSPDASIGIIIAGVMLIAEVLTSDEMTNHIEFL